MSTNSLPKTSSCHLNIPLVNGSFIATNQYAGQPVLYTSPSPSPIMGPLQSPIFIPSYGPNYGPMVQVPSLPVVDQLFCDPMFVFFPPSRSPSLDNDNLSHASNYSLSSGASEERDYERVSTSNERAKSNSASQRGPKYPWRSKQDKINVVHGEVKKRFQALNLWTEEQLRGADTVRTHVKTFQGLVKIHHALDKVLGEVQILQFAAPISMKNKWQKKGFIVYIKLAQQEDVQTVIKIFKNVEWDGNFSKTDVALTVEEKRELAA